MNEVVVTCPECHLQAKVLPREDQMIGNDQSKCSHRTNPLNCPTLRFHLSVGRQELNERRITNATA
jgi:hypothetical protein